MKNAVVIYNKTKPHALSFYKETREYLIEKNIEILESKDIEKADFMIVIGGDGTLLAASKRIIDRNIPVVAVN